MNAETAEAAEKKNMIGADDGSEKAHSSPAVDQERAAGESPGEDPVQIARVPARMIAALVDYTVTSAIFALLTSLPALVDAGAWLVVLSAGTYFTLCHSALGQGQSFGKKLFRLRVMRNAGDTAFLSVPRSAVRYLAFFGIIIALSEVPPVFYRHYGITASLELLEANMLLALLVLSISAALMLVDPLHRTLHDRISGSVLVSARAPASITERDSAVEATLRGRTVPMSMRATALAISILIAALMWWSGVALPPEMRAIAEVRYLVESEMPSIRVASVEPVSDTLANAPRSETLDSERRRIGISLLLAAPIAPELEDQLAREFVTALRRHGALDPAKVDEVIIRFFRKPGSGGAGSEPAAHAIPVAETST